MESADSFDFSYPPLFWVGLAVLGLLVIEGVIRWKGSWGLPALMVYGTAAAWYYGDILYNDFAVYRMEFSEAIIGRALLQVLLFLIGFRLFVALTTTLAAIFYKKTAAPQPTSGRITPTDLQYLKIFQLLLTAWLAITLYGLYRVQFAWFDYFFPYLSGNPANPWLRGRIGGGLSFLISGIEYVHTFLIALFGVLAVLTRRKDLRAICILLCLLTWAPIFLGRTRNTMLVLLLPSAAAFFLYTRVRLVVKVGILAGLFLALNAWMKFVIETRNFGVLNQFNEGKFSFSEQEDVKHLGLNMFEELCWINTFIENGTLEINNGYRYFSDFAVVIPRALWPNKPLIGFDYAIARGADVLATGEVVTTFSTGMIGQGVTNFGGVLGVLSTSFLMALWAGWLQYLRFFSHSFLRSGLFLLGLGLTFNLGRDIGWLVLFPMLFGFIFVKGMEKLLSKNFGQT